MSMQVTSLPIGSGLPAPVQKEQKPHSLPIERKESSSKGEPVAEALQSGAQNAQSSDLKQTVSDLQNISLTFNRRLKFEIDQDSKEIIIKVIDNETDKVIRVLPPEELQRLHSRIRETMGFLFDRMV